MKYKQNIPQVKYVGFNNNFHQRNQIGLSSAYSTKNKLFIKDDTMYIAGTSGLQDAFDDLIITAAELEAVAAAEGYTLTDEDRKLIGAVGEGESAADILGQ